MNQKRGERKEGMEAWSKSREGGKGKKGREGVNQRERQEGGGRKVG